MITISSLTYIFVLSLIVSSITFTISKSDVFKPIRKSLSKEPVFNKLVNCPYCLSHYVTFLILMFTFDTYHISTRYNYLIHITGLYLFDVVFTLFAVVTLSIVFISIISKVYFNTINKSSVSINKIKNYSE